MSTTTTWWRCIGIPPRVSPCNAGGVYEQALTGGAAEKHVRDTGHGTTTSIRGPIPSRTPEGGAT